MQVGWKRAKSVTVRLVLISQTVETEVDPSPIVRAGLSATCLKPFGPECIMHARFEKPTQLDLGKIISFADTMGKTAQPHRDSMRARVRPALGRINSLSSGTGWETGGPSDSCRPPASAFQACWVHHSRVKELVAAAENTQGGREQ